MIEEGTQSSPVKPARKRRIHWHIFFSHFPVATLAVCGGFQILHLFFLPSCLELASAVCLIGATVTLVPTVLSGQLTWKNQYHGSALHIFLRKRITAYVMLMLSVLILAYWARFLHQLDVHAWTFHHWFYFSGTMLLFTGAVLEGYWGSYLHHR